MKKILLLLLVLGTLLPGYAQPVWKDSVKVKQKINDAYHLDGFIYFKTKKGWGVYDNRQKLLLLEPAYQFVKVFEHNERFILFVQNNRVGRMDMQLNVEEPAQYTRLGKISSYADRIIKDNKLFDTDSLKTFFASYQQLWYGAEQSLAVYDGKVFMNESDRAELDTRFPLINSIGEDSLDAAGNFVMSTPGVTQNSGVFDLKTGKWIIPVGEYAKVGFAKRNILLRKEVVKNNLLVEQYFVMTPDQNTVRIPEGENQLYSKKAVSLILSDYQPAYVYCPDSSQFNYAYIFESGGKYGLYSQFNNMVLLEPQYDFIYYKAPSVFTVKNGKIGLTGFAGNLTPYENEYQHLSLLEFIHVEENMHLVNCDNNVEMDDDYLNDGSLSGKNLSKLHTEYGLSMFNGKVIVQDFVVPDNPRMQEVMQVDEIGEPTMRTVEGYKGSCFTGVFDPAAKKWLVPQPYSIIQPYAEGYACLKACSWQMLYSYYNKEGKAVFTDRSFEEIKKDDKSVQLLSNFGKGKTDILFDAEGEYDAILRSEGRSGVFCFENLKWKVEPVYQYIGHHALNHLFTVVDSGKTGMLAYDYSVRVPVQYQRISLLEKNGFLCANDTFLYSIDSLNMAGLADTSKLEKYRLGMAYVSAELNVSLEKNKLFTEEGYYNTNMVMYDDWGNENSYTLDTSRTVVADVLTGQRIPFRKGWMVNEWDHGFMTRDATGMYRAYDAAGKNPVELTKSDSAAHNKKMLWTWEPDMRYFHDPTGKIVVTDVIDDIYFVHKYTPIGNVYNYYDGKQWIKGPDGFKIMCAGQNGLLLGYTMEEDKKRQTAVKKYQYYDLATKQYSAVELELSSALVNVYPVKDGFVLFNYDHVAKLYNCIVLNADLKTVKSTFRKLKTWKANAPWHMGPSPWFELHADKKIMYFDKDFQFIHECNYQDQPKTIYTFNRTILKSKFKTIVMDWAGNLLKQ